MKSSQMAVLSVATLALSLILSGCGTSNAAGTDAVQPAEESSIPADATENNDGMYVPFDDVILIDNEYMTMWLTGFTKWVGTMNGVPNTTEYYLNVKVENKGDMAFYWYAGDAYIGKEGVHASTVNGYETQPGKVRDCKISVCREHNPYEPIDSIDSLYDLEFEVDTKGFDEDYYGDDYMHDIFSTRVNIYDHVDKPGE